MTEKFTPGPWTKMNATDVFEGYWNGRQVADCMVDNDINYPQQKANAALIAAAPELYEALEKLINDLPDCTIDWARDGMGNTNANCIVNSRDKGKAALAKARGEESTS